MPRFGHKIFVLALLLAFLASACASGGDFDGDKSDDGTPAEDVVVSNDSGPPGDLAQADTTPPVDTNTPPEDVQGPAGSGSFTFQIEHVAQGGPFELNTPYPSGTGKDFKLELVRYWVSNIVLHGADNSIYEVSKSYYLFEQLINKTRLSVTIDGIPAGDYTAVTFSIGVDKEHNHSLDVMEGELSTAVDMSWNWNSGYIFFKVTGTYGPTGDFLKAHLGFDSCYRTVFSEWPETITIDSAHDTLVSVPADIGSIFLGVELDVMSAIVGGPPNSPAGQIADNYGAMFAAPTVSNDLK